MAGAKTPAIFIGIDIIHRWVQVNGCGHNDNDLANRLYVLTHMIHSKRSDELYGAHFQSNDF